MENDVLTEGKPQTIKLADGKEYTLPIMDLTSLANIEKTMGIGGEKVKRQMEAEPLQTLQLFAYSLLKENHPELTREQAGHLITLKELPQFSQTISVLLAVSS